jgi:hypothetical protein
MKPAIKNFIELIFAAIFCVVGGGLMARGFDYLPDAIGVVYMGAGFIILWANLDRLKVRWDRL